MERIVLIEITIVRNVPMPVRPAIRAGNVGPFSFYDSTHELSRWDKQGVSYNAE